MRLDLLPSPFTAFEGLYNIGSKMEWMPADDSQRMKNVVHLLASEKVLPTAKGQRPLLFLSFSNFFSRVLLHAYNLHNADHLVFRVAASRPYQRCLQRDCSLKTIFSLNTSRSGSMKSRLRFDQSKFCSEKQHDLQSFHQIRRLVGLTQR